MKVERMLYLAEYKRRQAAPGVKVTRKNFGRDRRYPITSGSAILAPKCRQQNPRRSKTPVRAKAGAADF